MAASVTLCDLDIQRVAPQPHEAVAIVLTLMETQPLEQVVPATADSGSPLPSRSDISLARDGSVACPGLPSELSTAGIAALLQDILAGTPQIPPGLLYAIARARRAVEAPPFESPEAFCRALARFERGARRDVVSALVGRFDAAIETAPTRVDRRWRGGGATLVSDLRHELRVADRRAYQRDSVRIPDSAIKLGTLTRFEPAAIACGFVVALACFAVGDRPPIPPRDETVPATQRIAQSPIAALESAIPSDVPNRVAVSARSAPAPKPHVQKRRVHHASRFAWFRRLFRIHDDF